MAFERPPEGQERCAVCAHERASASERAVDISAGLSNLKAPVRELLVRSSSPNEDVHRTNVPILQQQRRLTKAEIKQLLHSYRSGTSIDQLCRSWRINSDTVYEHLRRAGVVPNRVNKLRCQEISIATELYRSGLSLAAVGERLGVDAKTVRAALAAAGVPIRPRRGWPQNSDTPLR